MLANQLNLMPNICPIHLHTFGKECLLCEADELKFSPIKSIDDRLYVYQFWLSLYERGYDDSFCKLILHIGPRADIDISDFTELCDHAPLHIQRIIMMDYYTFDRVAWFPYGEFGRLARIDVLKKAIADCDMCA